MTEEAQVMNNPSLLNSIPCPELSAMYGRTYIYMLCDHITLIYHLKACFLFRLSLQVDHFLRWPAFQRLSSTIR